MMSSMRGWCWCRCWCRCRPVAPAVGPAGLYPPLGGQRQGVLEQHSVLDLVAARGARHRSRFGGRRAGVWPARRCARPALRPALRPTRRRAPRPACTAPGRRRRPSTRAPRLRGRRDAQLGAGSGGRTRELGPSCWYWSARPQPTSCPARVPGARAGRSTRSPGCPDGDVAGRPCGRPVRWPCYAAWSQRGRGAAAQRRPECWCWSTRSVRLEGAGRLQPCWWWSARCPATRQRRGARAGQPSGKVAGAVPDAPQVRCGARGDRAARSPRARSAAMVA